jgi:hypothetical protein
MRIARKQRSQRIAGSSFKLYPSSTAKAMMVAKEKMTETTASTKSSRFHGFLQYSMKVSAPMRT